MLKVSPAKFAQALATATVTEAKASKALSQALIHVKPLSAEMHELFLSKPVEYAECLRKVAAIVERLPKLTEDAEQAKALLNGFTERACNRCQGTGTYYGATSATRSGHAYCFYCNGSGEKGK